MTDGNNKPSKNPTTKERPLFDSEIDRRALLKATGAGVIGATNLTHKGGTGRVSADESPTMIEDWHDLDAIRSSSTGKFALAADLDANTPGYDEHVGAPAKGWEPITIQTEPGIPDTLWAFDGNEHSITNLVIDRPDEEDVGLFGHVFGGRIQSLSVRDAEIRGHRSVGAIIGDGRTCEVVNSDATGLVSGTSSVGGLLGLGVDPGSPQIQIDGLSVSNSQAAVTVRGFESVGGLLGGLISGEVVNSYATGTVSGDQNVGGLLGTLSSVELRPPGRVRRSFATGSLIGGAALGGLVGDLGGATYDSGRGSVFGSYATASVDGKSVIGGLVGILGQNGSVSESYAAGALKGEGSVGGLVGGGASELGEPDPQQVTKSYWDVPATGQDKSFAGIGLGSLTDDPPAEEMTGETATEYMEFDFKNMWRVQVDPDYYPVLEWVEKHPEAIIEVTRQTTSVNSPVTVQVVKPTDEEFEYYWRVADKPEESDPGLLHGQNYEEIDRSENVDSDGAQTLGEKRREKKPHAALRPDKQTTNRKYELEVEVYDENGEFIASGRETIDVDTLDLQDDFDVDFSIEGVDTASELAEMYAPVFHFHTSELYHPTRYEAFVENAELHIPATENPITDITLVTLGDENIHSDYGITDEENKLFLTSGQTGNPEEAYQRYQQRYPPTIYANVTETEFDGDTYIGVTYWAFYLFDPKKGEATNALDDALKSLFSSHASDTETVTILFDQSGPQWVAGAQHYSGEYMRWEKAVHQSDSEPFDVYPAKGAHSSFFVNTQKYERNIPAQARWLPSSQSTRTLDGTVDLSAPISLIPDIDEELLEDATGTETVWRPAHEGGSYDVVMLPDNPDNRDESWRQESWTRFAGEFDSDHALLAGGTFPQQRIRFDDPGAWVSDQLPEHRVLDDDIEPDFVPTEFPRFVVENGSPSAFEIRNFHNRGKKPHTHVVNAEIKTRTTDQAGATASSQLNTIKQFTEPLGWDEVTTIEIPLENLSLPPEGQVIVDVAVRTYPEEIATHPRDTVYTVQERASLRPPSFGLDLLGSGSTEPTVEFLNSDPTGVSDQVYWDENDTTPLENQQTVGPGDEVTSTVVVSNNDEMSETVSVTLMIERGEEIVYPDQPVDMQEVSLGAGETQEVTLSWTVTKEIPEGDYDLVTEVWLETTSDELSTQLASGRHNNALEVEKPMGELSVTAALENTVVTVDGTVVGEAPLTLELTVGTYEIVAIHETYELASQTISIDRAETTTVSFELQDSEENPENIITETQDREQDRPSRTDVRSAEGGSGNNDDSITEILLPATVGAGVLGSAGYLLKKRLGNSTDEE